MANAPIDQNTRQGLLALSSVDGVTLVALYADPVTHRLLVDIAGGAGDVVGPGSSTQDALARWDNTSGTLLADSTVQLTDAGILSPVTSDTATLGSDTLMWSDLFLASGAVINFNNGDVTITHSSNALTFAGGTINLGTATASTLLATTSISLEETGAGTDTITLQAPSSIAASYTLTLPVDDGNSGEVLATDGNGVLSWVSNATGITIGTTTITSGTTTRILYDNAGVVGEYTLTGTGTVVAMQTNPRLSGLTMTDATNIVLDTTTGTKIGTATTQKLAFYNSTPIVKPTGDVATALSNLGLVTTPTVAANTVSSANEATDTTCFPLFITASGTQTLQPKNNTGLTFNSNTASLGATLMTATTSVTSATIRASSNDSGSLGASGTAFSDLFLASGALIDFAAGNSVITHSSGILTVSTGDLRVTTAGTNTASVVTVGGTQTLTNKITSLTVEPATDDTFTGEQMTGFNAGATTAQWDAVYLSSSSTWLLTDADAAATAGGVMIGLGTAAGSNGNPLTVVTRGVVRNDGWNWATVGGPLYLDTTTSGGLTQTAPSGTDDIIRVVGYAMSDDCIYFNPSNDWITHT